LICPILVYYTIPESQESLAMFRQNSVSHIGKRIDLKKEVPVVEQNQVSIVQYWGYSQNAWAFWPLYFENLEGIFRKCV